MADNGLSASDKEQLRDEIESLQSQLDSLKSSMPAHSLSPAMLQQIEDLEADIAHKQGILDEQSETGEQ